MKLDTETCYEALLTHDPRFDGVVFVGVSTTRVYCRTVCPARTPRPQNCAFFRSAAAAECAGFRPCLRCRPELAPGNARVDASNRLASAIAGRIEDGILTEATVGELAEQLQISERHLRRVIQQEFGVSPIDIAQTQRLLLAKRLLTDTSLSVTEAAFASGFSSLRRFNTLIRERYRLTPSEIRRNRSAAGKAPDDGFVCELAYRPPFDWDSMLSFLESRALRGVEAISEKRYARTIAVGKHRGWIQVKNAPERRTLQVELSSSLVPVVYQVLARVKRLFDLAAEPQRIAERLGGLAKRNPGLRVPGAFDGFEVSMRAIIGQQVSVKAARTLAGRLVAGFGDSIQTPIESLSHLTPDPARLLEVEPSKLVALGILRARVESIRALARGILDQSIVLEPGPSPERVIRRLTELPGVGEWTAHYMAMRALSWPDAFPHGDLGVRKALNEHRKVEILKTAEAWRPWRSYAVMHLWKSLEAS
jgi:AraC family transcriptional regulator, regulatory protein of adaptative response / DNA-3-methyladenine glycosylase II